MWILKLTFDTGAGEEYFLSWDALGEWVKALKKPEDCDWDKMIITPVFVEG